MIVGAPQRRAIPLERRGCPGGILCQDSERRACFFDMRILSHRFSSSVSPQRPHRFTPSSSVMEPGTCSRRPSSHAGHHQPASPLRDLGRLFLGRFLRLAIPCSSSLRSRSRFLPTHLEPSRCLVAMRLATPPRIPALGLELAHDSVEHGVEIQAVGVILGG